MFWITVHNICRRSRINDTMDKLFSDAFDKLDANKDGKITQEDIDVLLSKIEPKIKSVRYG